VDPKEYQPVALLPLPALPARRIRFRFIPSSGCPGEKGYTLKRRSQRLWKKCRTLLLLSDRFPEKVGERLKAGLLMIGTFPNIGCRNPTWEVNPSRLLTAKPSVPGPSTYFRGSSQIRLVLRIFESKKGDLVWVAEGTIKASSDSAGTYSQKLADQLLQSLPPVSPPKK
jgi:hypothetical protein